MNKKYIAIILSLVLIFGAVMLISGCNKDDEGATLPNESTDAISETEQTTEEPSVDATESTTKPEENQTVSSTKPTETTTDNNEPATCDNCGGIIVDDSDTSHPLIGNYCDGYCDEWMSF